MSVDPFLVAVLVLALAVVASIVPLVPAGLVSMVGVGYYWYATGEPGPFVLAGLLALGLLTVVVDWLGGALSAHVGGASLRTTAIAALVSLPLLFVFGPLGVVLGVAGTVFVFEYRRHGDAEKGLRTAGYATVGLLASTAMQVVLTGTILLAFVLAIA